MKGVSVIICCYNSVERIGPTLEHLVRQKVSPIIDWEILIVDNGSTDHLADFTERIWVDIGTEVTADFRIVVQELPGLSNARHKGIEEAKYDYLLFCDDDNWLCEGYVETVFHTMETDSEIGALGGHGEAIFECSPSARVFEYAGTFATGPQGTETGDVKESHHVYGAGCTYRRFALLNLFDQGFIYRLTGRKGKLLLAGDDHELCYALFLNGYKIWYNKNLKFKHFIPCSRGTEKYIKNNLKGFAHSSFILSIYKLVILSRTSKRAAWKNSWLWICLQKSRFTIKNIIKKLLEGPYDQLLLADLKSDLTSLFLMLRGRRSFYKIREELENSSWVKL